MTQTRKASVVESITNVVVGYVLAVLGQYLVFPVFGLRASHTDHLAIGAFFVGISLVRSYTLRRVFNWWQR